MDPVSLSAVVLTVAASALGAIAKQVLVRQKSKLETRKLELEIQSMRMANVASEPIQPPAAPSLPRLAPGMVVLSVFAVVISIFGAFSLFYYWPLISSNGETLMFAVWLFLAMVAGMFVQVLAANYRAGRPLFDASASQLIFPLLFALIVYYPIWALAASSPHNLFSFYAAFLNGYFWESVVSAAKAPTPNSSPTK